MSNSSGIFELINDDGKSDKMLCLRDNDDISDNYIKMRNLEISSLNFFNPNVKLVLLGVIPYDEKILSLKMYISCIVLFNLYDKHTDFTINNLKYFAKWKKKIDIDIFFDFLLSHKEIDITPIAISFNYNEILHSVINGLNMNFPLLLGNFLDKNNYQICDLIRRRCNEIHLNWYTVKKKDYVEKHKLIVINNDGCDAFSDHCNIIGGLTHEMEFYYIHGKGRIYSAAKLYLGKELDEKDWEYLEDEDYDYVSVLSKQPLWKKYKKKYTILNITLMGEIIKGECYELLENIESIETRSLTNDCRLFNYINAEIFDYLSIFLKDKVLTYASNFPHMVEDISFLDKMVNCGLYCKRNLHKLSKDNLKYLISVNAISTTNCSYPDEYGLLNHTNIWSNDPSLLFKI